MRYSIFCLGLSLLISCKHHSSQDTEDYKLISYQDIKVDSSGHLPHNPYIVQLSQKHKQLIVVGTEHSDDTTNRMYFVIDSLFKAFKPEVGINEGGNITRSFPDNNLAIQKMGEIGLLKFLCDSTNIKMMNGDEPEALEFSELSQAFSRKEALVFYAAERFFFPYQYGEYTGNLKEQYELQFAKRYKYEKGINFSNEEMTFAYFAAAYQQYFGKPFVLDDLRQKDFVPFSNTHHFCEVARKSKECRDRYLLKQIATQLKNKNRVLVVYGGWHVLAIEPALHQLMERTASSLL